MEGEKCQFESRPNYAFKVRFRNSASVCQPRNQPLYFMEQRGREGTI